MLGEAAAAEAGSGTSNALVRLGIVVSHILNEALARDIYCVTCGSRVLERRCGMVNFDLLIGIVALIGGPFAH